VIVLFAALAVVARSSSIACPINPMKNLNGLMDSAIGNAESMRTRVRSIDSQLALGDRVRDEGVSASTDIEEAAVNFLETDDISPDGKGPLDKMLEAHLQLANEKAERQADRAMEEDEGLSKISMKHVVQGTQIGKGAFKTVFKGTVKGEPAAIGVITTNTIYDGDALTSDEIFTVEEELRMISEVREHKIGGIHFCRRFFPRTLGYHKKGNILTGTKAMYVFQELADGHMRGMTIDGKGRQIGVALQLALALACIHSAGYLHLDLKPMNFLIKDTKVMVTDFGVSEKATAGSGRSGTPGFMPRNPEKVENSKQLWDMHELGVSFQKLGLEDKFPIATAGMTQRDHTKRLSLEKLLKNIGNKIKTGVDHRIEQIAEKAEGLHAAIEGHGQKMSVQDAIMAETRRVIREGGATSGLGNAIRCAFQSEQARMDHHVKVIDKAARKKQAIKAKMEMLEQQLFGLNEELRRLQHTKRDAVKAIELKAVAPIDDIIDRLMKNEISW